jgi:hypothetical protein
MAVILFHMTLIIPLGAQVVLFAAPGVLLLHYRISQSQWVYGAERSERIDI